MKNKDIKMCLYLKDPQNCILHFQELILGCSYNIRQYNQILISCTVLSETPFPVMPSLVFLCASFSAFILNVAINRDSVSQLRFLLHSHVHIISCAISLISCLKYLYFFSFHFNTLDFVVLQFMF